LQNLFNLLFLVSVSSHIIATVRGVLTFVNDHLGFPAFFPAVSAAGGTGLSSVLW